MRLLDKKGFSLLELLVVMAVMAVVLAIAIPAMQSRLIHTKLTRAARDLATDLNGARSLAITKNIEYRLDFTLNSGTTPDTYRRSYRTSTGASWETDSTRVPREVPYPINISSPGASFNVEFNPNGTATAVAICLQNTADTADTLSVSVSSATGRVQTGSGC